MKKIIPLSLLLSGFLFAQEVSVFQNNNQTQSTTNSSVSTLPKTQQTETSIMNETQSMQEVPIVNIITSNLADERMNINKDFFIIDIRAPEKVAVIGAINSTNLHIAYEKFSTENYQFTENKYFYEELKYEITSKNIPFEKEIYIFDNYGKSISQKVGEFLLELGYLNIYVIEDGFEGSKARYGKFKNQRVVNGWKNKTDKWSLDFSSKKYWNQCKYSFIFEPIDRKVCEPDFIEVTQ